MDVQLVIHRFTFKLQLKGCTYAWYSCVGRCTQILCIKEKDSIDESNNPSKFACPEYVNTENTIKTVTKSRAVVGTKVTAIFFSTRKHCRMIPM